MMRTGCVSVRMDKSLSYYMKTIVFIAGCDALPMDRYATNAGGLEARSRGCSAKIYNAGFIGARSNEGQGIDDECPGTFTSKTQADRA
jgi:hypothetical protein